MRTGRFIAIAIVLAGIAVAPRLVTAATAEPPVESSPTPALLPSTTDPAPAGSEIDRLIREFTDRLVDHDDYLDVRTLGDLHLVRARRDGDPADYADAVRLLSEAHRRDPDDPDAAVPLAHALLGTHRFAAARDVAAGVLDTDPGNLEARAVSGDVALATGDFATATADFARLADALPDDPSVSVRRSELAWQTGDVDASRALAAQATDQAERAAVSDDAYYLVYEAHRALDVGDHGLAAADLAAALDLKPDDPFALAEQGRLLAATGDLAGAERAYRRSTDLRPDPATLQALGEVRIARGDAEGAADAFATIEAVAALTAGEPVHRAALARYHADHGDPEIAVELARLEAETRSDPATLHTLGRALAGAGRLGEARRVLDDALASGIRDARLLYQSAVVWNALGDREEALADVGAALAIDRAFHPIEGPAAAALSEALP